MLSRKHSYPLTYYFSFWESMLRKCSEMWIKTYIQRFHYSAINKAYPGEKYAPFGSSNIHLKYLNQNTLMRIGSKRKAEMHLKILEVQFLDNANHNPKT